MNARAQRRTFEDLLVLAPLHERDRTASLIQPVAPRGFRCPGDRDYNLWVEELLDAGVAFPFDEEWRLPRELPPVLDDYRAVMLDPARREEFASGANAERLLEFQRGGGYVYYPAANEPPDRRRGHVFRLINTAGLTLRNPGLVERLTAVDDAKWVSLWKEMAPAQARILLDADAGWAWGDPVGYHFYWPLWEAAEHYGDDTLLEPVWMFTRAGLDRSRWTGSLACGSRFALKHYERFGDESILRRLAAENDPRPEGARKGRAHWRLDGVRLNMDLKAPPGADPDDPPAKVRENAWVWCEMAGRMGDTLGYLSKVSGDPRYAAQAVRQVLTTHRWNYCPDIQLWYHVGRPSGPDRRTAPWARGNGWLLYGIRGLLEDLPPDHASRPELVDALAKGLEGLLRWQGPLGLWHNVLDATERESRQDSSGTWMFINVYARAYWKGWLRDERIPAMCEAAWRGLKTKIWRGLPVGHCGGTSHMPSRQAYLERPHGKFLGTPLLLSYVELERMRAAQ